MIDPVTFAEARLDEDERELRSDPPVGLGYATLAARVRIEIAAGRRILARHRDCGTPAGLCNRHNLGWNGPAGCYEMRDLLVRWAEHPDFDEVWWPRERLLDTDISPHIHGSS